MWIFENKGFELTSSIYLEESSLGEKWEVKI